MERAVCIGWFLFGFSMLPGVYFSAFGATMGFRDGGGEDFDFDTEAGVLAHNFNGLDS
jgi:hypothetical protein